LGAAAPEGLAGRAFLAETPIDDPGDDRRNVATLWELAGLKDLAPTAEKGFSMLTAALKKKISGYRKTGKRGKRNAKMQRTRRHGEKRAKAKKRRIIKSGTRKEPTKKKRG